MSSITKALIMSAEDSAPDYINMPLTFIAKEANSTVKYQKSASYTPTLQYRTSNKGEWNNYTFNTVITLTNEGDIVQFQNLTDKNAENYSTNMNKFICTGKLDLCGNIYSMVNWITSGLPTYACINIFNGATSIYSAENLYIGNTDYLAGVEAFHGTFTGCINLTTPPKMPITTLSTLIYQEMFMGCTSLSAAPELPATTLGNRCYVSMFRDCTNLVTGPSELPATIIPMYAYSYMFYGCSKLTAAPILSAGQSLRDYNNYEHMFENCTSLSSAPVMPRITNLTNYGYFAMFQGCTSLSSTPDMSTITSMGTAGCGAMFKNCNHLTTIINLPPPGGNYCFQSMFEGCTALSSVPQIDNLYKSGSNYVCDAMFKGCTSLTQSPFQKLTGVNNATYTFRSMFEGCTSLSAAPVLPALGVTSYSYQAMFKGCTSLSAAPVLPAGTLSQNCYQSMFEGCTSLSAAPILSATNLDVSCYQSMFKGCTSLKTPPALSATTLANNCYQEMFMNCTSLSAAPALPATNLTASCYNSMFRGCTGLKTPADLSATIVPDQAYAYMYRDCNSLSSYPYIGVTEFTGTSNMIEMFMWVRNASNKVNLNVKTLTNNCLKNAFAYNYNINDIEVKFNNWNDAGQATNGWLTNAPGAGTFTCPFDLQQTFDASHIPANWTVVYNNANRVIIDNQSFTALLNESINYQIDFKVHPTDTVVTFSVDPNYDPLPTGLSLDPTTGIISGTPTVIGTSNCKIIISNNNSLPVYDTNDNLISDNSINVEIKVTNIPFNGLDFYLPFDTDFKDEINDIDATNTGGTLFQIATESGGRIGSYLQCTKSNGNGSQYLIWNNTNNLCQYGTNDFSVCFWLRAPYWNTYKQHIILCKKAYDSSPGFVFYRDGDNDKIDVRLGKSSGAGSFEVMTSAPATNSNWVFWCFVRSNGTGTWYKNGVIDTSANTPRDVTNTGENIKIGHSSAWSSSSRAYFDLKALRIYNRALTSSEISALNGEF